MTGNPYKKGNSDTETDNTHTGESSVKVSYSPRDRSWERDSAGTDPSLAPLKGYSRLAMMVDFSLQELKYISVVLKPSWWHFITTVLKLKPGAKQGN